MKSLVLCLGASVLVTAACGDSKSSMNPVAPSAVVVDGSQNSASGGVSRTQGKGGVPGPPDGKGGKGNGNDNGKGHDQPTTPALPPTPGNTTPPTDTSPDRPGKVQIEGLISAKGASSITVNGQVVSVPNTAVIRHGDRNFTFADLQLGDRVHVKADRLTAGGTATSTLEATEVKLQNPGDEDDDDGDPTPPPVTTMLVSVSALDASASETGFDLGVFAFTRSGDTTAALSVTIALSGTATNAVDYQGVPLTVTFAAGQATATVLVVPLPDATVEAAETVVVTVVDGAGYAAGSPATATVTISN